MVTPWLLRSMEVLNTPHRHAGGTVNLGGQRRRLAGSLTGNSGQSAGCCDVLSRLVPEIPAVPMHPGRWLTWVP